MAHSPRLLALLAVLAPLSACDATERNELPPSEMTAEHRAALADTLLMEADRWVDALERRDAAEVGALLTDEPDLTYIDNGNIYPDKEALLEAARGFFDRTERLEGHWDPARVVVLGPDAGVFTGVFHGRHAWEDGKAWTFAYRRATGGGWEIVHAHETTMPEGRIDLYR